MAAGDSHLRTILAGNVRRIRLSQSLSQEELADKAGLHRTFVGAVERAERNISLGNIEKLAAALGVAASILLEVAE